MRKLISIVLTLSLVLGSLGFGFSSIFAADAAVKLLDIADNTNEEAIQTSYDLGIVTGNPDGTFEPEKAVNRAEFAALVARALAIPDSALSSYTTSTFLDTSGYSWAVPYLAFAQQKGIMKGDGYGNAMPGRTITPNEAVTMVLRALGYTDNASVLVGNWPANYVSLGQSLVLYDKVSNDVQMNKAAAAQMIYNALTVQEVQVDANSLVSYLYDKISGTTAAGAATNEIPRTLLTSGLNCAYNAKAVVTFADAARSSINLNPYVGALAILYTSNVTKKVVAITENESNFLYGAFDENTAGRLTTFKTVDGKTYNLSAHAQDVANEVAFPASTTSTSAIVGNYFAASVNGDDESYLDSRLTLATKAVVPGTSPAVKTAKKLIIGAEITGTMVNELHSIALWDINISGDNFLFESDMVGTKSFNGHDFPTDDYGDIDVNGFALVGVNYLEDIAVDNVVYIYKNAAKKISRIEVGTLTQAGSVSVIDGSDFTIGGTKIGKSPYSGATYVQQLKVNDEGTALLDYQGRIYEFQLSEASKGSYGVYLGDRGGAFGANAEVKLVDKTGAEQIYSVTTGYATGTTPLNFTPWLTVCPTPGGNVSADSLIEYSLSGGKIGGIRLGEVQAAGANEVNDAGTVLKTVLYGNLVIDSGVTVFVKDGSDFSLGSISDLKGNKLTQGLEFIQDNTNGRVRAILVDTRDAGADKVFVLISSLSIGSDGAGGTVDVVNGLSFDDGAGAVKKLWNFTDNSLRGTLGTTGRFAIPVEFRIDAEGVLKTSVTVAKPYPWLDAAVTGTATGGGVTIASDAVYGGSGSPFTIKYNTSGIGGAVGTAAFESNAVLYRKDGANWTAVKVSQGAINSDNADTTTGHASYIFYQTDDDKPFDIIVRVDNL
ncbi:MAG: S-layer homology domain-containing protein [Clostridiales Family XIII bacterium]|jgi:hypothetical protein|nr:S-layer homology domain-containing protein [Clostridiales Family XIII bacterium]